MHLVADVLCGQFGLPNFGHGCAMNRAARNIRQRGQSGQRVCMCSDPALQLYPHATPCSAVWPKTSIPGVLLHFHFRGMLHKKGVSFDQNDEDLQRNAVDCPAPAQPHQAGQADQLHGLQGTASLSGQA